MGLIFTVNPMGLLNIVQYVTIPWVVHYINPMGLWNAVLNASTLWVILLRQPHGVRERSVYTSTPWVIQSHQPHGIEERCASRVKPMGDTFTSTPWGCSVSYNSVGFPSQPGSILCNNATDCEISTRPTV